MAMTGPLKKKVTGVTPVTPPTARVKRQPYLVGGLVGKGLNAVAKGAKAYAAKAGIKQSPLAGAKQAVSAYKAGKAARAKKLK